MTEVLVGRDVELGELQAVLHQASGGDGRLVFIEGEAGIGKTSLLRTALARAGAMGFRCFVGRAEELERHRPFGAVAELLGIGRWGLRPPVTDGGEDDRALVARLLTDDTGQFPIAEPKADAEFRIVDALVDFVEHLSMEGPVVVALEDLQWSDPSTLLALNRLGRMIAKIPVVAIATLRPVPRSTELQALLDGLSSRGALHLVLERLDEDSVAALVEQIVGLPPGPRLRSELARAGGNPFFAAELVESLRREGAITESDGAAEVGLIALPRSLTSALLHRLSFLSQEALETLQVASILGRAFSVADLAAATGRRVPALTPILAASMRAGILGEDGAHLAFRHDLIREALYQEMPPALRAWLHLAAAHVLAESGRSADELAEHIVRGAAPGDLRAVEWLRTAAHQAATRSPSVAAELLQQALALAPATDPLRDTVLADLAMYRIWSGRLADAEAICREALGRDHDLTLEGKLSQCLIEAIIGQGRIEEGLREVDRAVASDALSDGDRARLWLYSSTCRAVSWDLSGAAASAEQALHASEQLGDEAEIGIALGNLAVVRHLSGEFREALRLARQCLQRIAPAVAAPSQPIVPVLALAASLTDLDCLEEAQAMLKYWQRFRLERGGAWRHPTEHFISAVGSFWSGDWDDAIRAVGAALDLVEATGVRRGTLIGHSLRSLIALHRGDLVTAEREVAAAEGEAATTGPQGRPDWMMWARALLLEAQGQQEEALTTLAHAWFLCSRAGVAAEYPVIGPDLVRMAMNGGRVALAEEVTQAIERLAASAGMASVFGAALRCRALVDSDAAVALQAVSVYRLSRRRRELALACEDAAALAGKDGYTAANAVALAEEARELYRRMDATGDVDRARRRLGSVWEGAVRHPAERAATAERGGREWERLTQAERRVAWLVANGMSNPAIARELGISKRTVQTHVSHALEKLGLTSRVELAVRVSGPERSDADAIAGSGG
jgi:DNA-binding CsgD family transcriptional regulator